MEFAAIAERECLATNWCIAKQCDTVATGRWLTTRLQISPGRLRRDCHLESSLLGKGRRRIHVLLLYRHLWRYVMGTRICLLGNVAASKGIHATIFHKPTSRSHARKGLVQCTQTEVCRRLHVNLPGLLAGETSRIRIWTLAPNTRLPIVDVVATRV